MLVPFATDFKNRCVMLSYPEKWWKDFRWFDLEPFESELVVEDYERGRSAARFIARDTESGIIYPIFLTDMMSLIPIMVNGHVKAKWQAKKRGQNYGIGLAK